MRDNFIFFKSFYDAISCLGEKAQLKLYKSIMKLNFNCCENMTELEQLCDEIETDLKQNRNVFAQFLLIKPHILKSMEASFNGRLGGAPDGNKNAKKNKLKEEEKEGEEEKEKDIICNSDFEKCFKIYSENCKNLLPLSYERRSRNILEELKEFLQETNYDFAYFLNLCKQADLLKKIVNNKIDFRSMIRNHIGIMNGKYSNKASPRKGLSQEFINEIFNKKRQEEGLKSG